MHIYQRSGSGYHENGRWRLSVVVNRKPYSVVDMGTYVEWVHEIDGVEWETSSPGGAMAAAAEAALKAYLAEVKRREAAAFV